MAKKSKNTVDILGMKLDQNVIFNILIIVGIIYAGQQGYLSQWFQQGYTGSNILQREVIKDTKIIEVLTQAEGDSCSIRTNKNTYLCSETVRVDITSDSACNVYISHSNEWRIFGSAAYQPTGHSIVTQIAPSPADTYYLRAICGDCTSNQVQIRTECEETTTTAETTATTTIGTTTTEPTTTIAGCVNEDYSPAGTLEESTMPSRCIDATGTYYDHCYEDGVLHEYYCYNDLCTVDRIGCTWDYGHSYFGYTGPSFFFCTWDACNLYDPGGPAEKCNEIIGPDGERYDFGVDLLQAEEAGSCIAFAHGFCNAVIGEAPVENHFEGEHPETLEPLCCWTCMW